MIEDLSPMEINNSLRFAPPIRSGGRKGTTIYLNQDKMNTANDPRALKGTWVEEWDD